MRLAPPSSLCQPSQGHGLTGAGLGGSWGSAPGVPPAAVVQLRHGRGWASCDPVFPWGGSGPAASCARPRAVPRVRRATAGAAPAALGLCPARLPQRGRNAVSAGGLHGREPGLGVRGRVAFRALRMHVAHVP